MESGQTLRSMRLASRKFSRQAPPESALTAAIVVQSSSFPVTMAMNLNTERQGDVLCALITGRIDGSNVAEFESSLGSAIEAGDRAVVMDMEKLIYISSAGLRAVLLTAKALKSQNSMLILCSLPDHIQEILEISGFDKILPIHDSRQSALATVAS